MTLQHFVRFNIAGLVGIFVQVTTLWCLTRYASVHYQVATIAAVALALAHNFLWHWRWTWGGRGLSSSAAARAFIRFCLTNGMVSLTVNVTSMPLLVSGAGLAPVPSTLIAIGTAGFVNFCVADVFVFRQRPTTACYDRIHAHRRPPACGPRSAAEAP